MSDPTGVLNEGLRGSYVLDHAIGEGGMATVYLAQDLKHQRPVALKVLKPELAQNLGPERFRREITTAARLQHPHILSVHDSGETQGQFWFTMPYVEGESLRDRLKREGALPIEDALRIAREAAQALQYAHERGIVHRDIKPENIMLTEDGSTLVADFGIARALETPAGTENLTQTGTALGTPQYMAPEQATGEKAVDARADQYALAATLFEMLTGEPPFTASTAAALVAKRFTSAVPSVRTRRPEVPAAVDDAIQRALALRAEDRFGTVQEFARAATSLMAMSSSDFRVVSSPDIRAVSTPGIGTPTVAIPAKRRVSAALVAVGVVAVAVVGALVARRGGTPAAVPPAATGAPAAAAVMRLAVLPFENLGDSADAYFAEGIADELRGKLTSVPGLEVIARSSSVQYRGSGKPAQEIAKELGVRYLLTGTVRWEKANGGKGRVRVSPELIEVSPSGAPASKWQQPFDAPITDVFQVQSDIASKVANALDVALGTSEQQKLAVQPTKNLAAYQAYLQGEAASQGMSSVNPADVRQALPHYERAVALDSTFALAWAQLSRARGAIYGNGLISQEMKAGAYAAAQRALALAPTLPEAHVALGDYYRQVELDPSKASTALNRALQLDPRNAEALSALAAVEQILGDWEPSIGHLQQAQAIDPRNRNTARRTAVALLWLRRYPEATAAVERTLQIAPNMLQAFQTKAMIRLAQGDLAGARDAIHAVPKEVPAAQVVTYIANFWDLYWLLDEAQQQLLLTLGPDAYDGNRAAYAIVHAQTYHLRGDEVRARAFADTAEVEFAKQLKDTPEDPQASVLRGLALAYAGRNAEAITVTDEGIKKERHDVGLSAPYYRLIRARVLLLTGAQDQAVAELERLLAKPFYVSRAWLKIDPTFESLRGNAAFQRLVGGA